ncbi:hypothetical protein GCM10022242_22220 [Nocardioides panacisoli]|uniref:Uncharacterized protein n=1 Tax=Nocardioides panacisoli TaxID=627624 RepID=A0ABP7IJQ7_9ACTN
MTITEYAVDAPVPAASMAQRRFALMRSWAGMPDETAAASEVTRTVNVGRRLRPESFPQSDP